MKAERVRPPRAFYNYDHSIKPFSGDDATFYASLLLMSKRTDELVAGYNNLVSTTTRKLNYLALTTQYIVILDETKNVIQFELAQLIKIMTPDDNMIYIEYKSKAKVDFSNPRELRRST